MIGEGWTRRSHTPLIEFTRTLAWAVLGDVIEVMDMKTVENSEE